MATHFFCLLCIRPTTKARKHAAQATAIFCTNAFHDDVFSDRMRAEFLYRAGREAVI
jgi:hypothetical protein